MAGNIIVCDHEPHVVRVISLKFMRADIDVLGISDIESCWKLLHGTERPELLILDDSLPSLEEAIQLIRRIRNEERLSGLPIVMLTAKSRELLAQRKDLVELNIADIVTKPFSPRELLATVCSLIDQQPNLQAPRSPRFSASYGLNGPAIRPTKAAGPR